jgi:hypothetical protein
VYVQVAEKGLPLRILVRASCALLASREAEAEQRGEQRAAAQRIPHR